jgi:hypothetical protein
LTLSILSFISPTMLVVGSYGLRYTVVKLMDWLLVVVGEALVRWMSTVSRRKGNGVEERCEGEWCEKG